MINNRQNGRRRGRGGNNGGGGNGQRGGNPGRPDSGNRIDSRARGNANQLYEKYKNLARDAQMSGDRVNTEYYLQFADHYFRVLSESRLRFEEQNPNAQPQRRIQPVDSFDDFDGDDDYGDEGEPIRAGEQQGGQDSRGEPRGQHDNGRQGQREARDYGRQDSRSDNGARQGNGSHQGGGQQGGGQQGQRDGQSRYDNQPRYDGRDEARGDARGNRRDGYGTDDGAQGDRGFSDQRGNDRFAVTGSPIANDPGEDSPDGAEPSPVEPRRRGRPPRTAREDMPVAEGAAPSALDADRLPPALSVAASDNGDPETPRPRRRRVRAAGAEIAPLG